MLKLWISLLIVLFLFYVLRLVAKKEVEMRSVISWLFLSVISLLVTWGTSFLEVLTHLLGFQVSSNLIFFLAICLLIYLVFSLTRQVSKQAMQIRKLSQQIALTEKMKSDEK